MKKENWNLLIFLNGHDAITMVWKFENDPPALQDIESAQIFLKEKRKLEKAPTLINWVPVNISRLSINTKQEEKYIFDCLGEEELLCQLAEEAGELTQAALKYRRTITEKNPTPKTSTEAFDNLLEELADVLLVSKILLIEETKERIYEIMNKKLGRWTSRLKKVD